MRKLLVLIVMAACGPDSGSGSISIDQLGNAIINEYCDLYVRCGVVPDVTACRKAFGNDINIDANLIAAVAAGKVIYDGDLARQCIDAAFASGTCDRNLIFTNRNSPAACDLTFAGTVGDAGACAINEECISRDCSIPSCPNACCQGTCVGGTVPMRAPLGAACSSTIPCAEGYCDSTMMTCQAFLADGAPCSSSSSCLSGSCNTTCQALVAEGGACTSTSMCRELGDSCTGAAAKTCSPLVGLGAACATSSDCMLTYACDATQHCAPRPMLGDACTGAGTCSDGSYCDQTALKCTAPKADGTACTSSTECQSKHCDTGATNTCITPPVCI